MKKSKVVCLGFKTGPARWKAHANRLAHGRLSLDYLFVKRSHSEWANTRRVFASINQLHFRN